MNPWHGVEFPKGQGRHFPVVVTTPKGSAVRYTLDRETGLLQVASLLPAGEGYPGNAGILPRTSDPEGYPLETLILGEAALQPLSLARVRPLGALRLLVAGLPSHRLVGVHGEDREASDYGDLREYPPYRLARWKTWIEEEGKTEVTGLVGREEAERLVGEARARYEERFAGQLLKGA